METLRIKVDPKNPQPEELEPAVAILRRGGLVAFPTETVYGLGVDAGNLESMSRLRWLKNRPATKPFAFLVSGYDQVLKLAGKLPPPAERVTKRFWPGPLTIIVRGHARQEIGLRYPAHAVTQEILHQLGNPIAATSGNVTGNPSSVTAEEVAEIFDGKIDCIVDSGPTVLREASTVVRFTTTGYEMLRVGIITESMLLPLIRKRILFVCTGNTCRSPMAEAHLKRMLGESSGVKESGLRKYGYHISSAGTDAAPGKQASKNAIRAMQESMIDLTRHLTRKLTPTMLKRADLIVAMTREIAERIKLYTDGIEDRIRILDPYGIADPVGGDLETYLHTSRQIRKCLQEQLAIFEFERS